MAAPATEWSDLDKKWEALEVPHWDADVDKWKKLEGEALEPLLDDVDLIDLAYVIENAEAGRKVPRWQDVPKGARINRGNLHRIQECISPYALSILVLSHPWLDPEHPDKGLDTMRRLLPCLKAFHEGSAKLGEHRTVGLMMDYPCMPQKSTSGVDDRTPEEKARFKRGLSMINEWYKHPNTTVLIYDVEMPGLASGHTNLRAYLQRGWCNFEFRASCLVKSMFCLWSLKGYERGGKCKSWAAAVQDAKSVILRAAPMTPEKFSDLLLEGVRSGEIAFTAKADLELVSQQYTRAFTSAFSECVKLNYATLKWPDSRMFELAEALAYAVSQGLLKKCGALYTWGNECTSEGTAAVKKAIEGTKISYGD